MSEANQAATVAWLESQVGCAVTSSTALVGGMSSQVERHELTDGRTVVTRHITNVDWLEREPHLIANEAGALDILEASDVHAPTVLATTKSRLAMTYLPGSMQATADELRRLAPALAADDGHAGVVDWVNACVGHPHAELGHCRWNLSVLVDITAAEAFLDTYLELAGQNRSDYSLYWDLAPVMSFLPGPIGGSAWRAVGRTDLTERVVVERTEQFIEHLLAS